jgi:hypothetical protein
MLLYLAADLLWATKIKSTADALGVACRPVRTMEMLAARLADSPVAGLMIDLEAGPIAMEMIAHVRQLSPSRAGVPGQGPHIAIVAFGPHVMVDQLRAAKAAGADTVLARGALVRALPEVITRLAGGQSIASQLND